MIGRIFDERGNRMMPTYAVKKSLRYRYYISAALIQGHADQAAKLNRVPAAEIEKLIISSVRKHLAEIPKDAARSDLRDNKELISIHIARVDVKGDHLAIQFAQGDPSASLLVVPWKKTPSKRAREIILPASRSSHDDPRPIRAETRAKLITAIAKGRHWLDELIAGTVSNVEQIAAREKCTVRQVNMMLSLAFLAPGLVQAAVDGRLPRGIGVANLRDAPAAWSLQHAKLGLAS